MSSSSERDDNRPGQEEPLPTANLGAGAVGPGGKIGRYKLLEYFENGTVQLFDLGNDIGESNDLAESRAEVTQELKKMLHDWRDEVDAKMPYPKTATSKPAPGSRVAKPAKNRPKPSTSSR